MVTLTEVEDEHFQENQAGPIEDDDDYSDTGKSVDSTMLQPTQIPQLNMLLTSFPPIQILRSPMIPTSIPPTRP